jgi:hypothetical protein
MNDNDTFADDLRKDSLALMDLLADEKHKSEALAAELVRINREWDATVRRGGRDSYRVRELEADKADLLRVLGVADERIRALEAEVAEARRCLDGGTDCMDDKRKLRAALRKIATQECIMVPLRQGGNCGMCVSCIARSALETKGEQG